MLTYSTGSKLLPPLSKGPKPVGKEPGPGRGRCKRFYTKQENSQNDKDKSMDTAGTARGQLLQPWRAICLRAPQRHEPLLLPTLFQEAECVF